MSTAFKKNIDTLDLARTGVRVFSGTSNEAVGSLFVSVKDTCDQEKREASLTGDEQDGFGLFELTAHLRGIEYVRRFHLASGAAAVIPSKHLTNLSLNLLEWTGGRWEIQADILPEESCASAPTALFLHTEDAPGTYRVPHGADLLIPEVSDPNFAWRTRGGATAKTLGLLSIPMSTGVSAEVVSGLYSTSTTFRAIWRIQP